MSVATQILKKFEEVGLSEILKWTINLNDKKHKGLKTWSIKSDYCHVTIVELSVDYYSLSVIYPKTRNGSTDKVVEGNLSKLQQIFKKSNVSWKLPLPDLLKRF